MSNIINYDGEKISAVFQDFTIRLQGFGSDNFSADMAGLPALRTNRISFQLFNNLCQYLEGNYPEFDLPSLRAAYNGTDILNEEDGEYLNDVMNGWRPDEGDLGL